MKRSISKQQLPLIIGAFISMIVPSVSLFHKYTGIIGMAAYCAIGLIAIVLIIQHFDLIKQTFDKIPQKYIRLLVLTTLVFLVGLYTIIFPLANSGKFGEGSDGDEALNLATTELLNGRYPYYPRTYLDNPISPLPGALILAIPFVLLGNATYQNILWIILFFLTLRSLLKNDTRAALLLSWLIILLSPESIHYFAIGSDYIANCLYIFVFSVWMVKVIPHPEQPVWKKVLTAILMGIGLSSRQNFLMITPLLLSVLVHKAGWRKAILYCAIVAIAFCAVTLPFYLYDPAGFSPLHTNWMLRFFNYMIPYAGICVPVASGIFGLVLARYQKPTYVAWFRNCVWILFIPVVFGTVLHSIYSGTMELYFSKFGVFMLFFGATAFWLALEDGSLARGHLARHALM